MRPDRCHWKFVRSRELLLPSARAWAPGIPRLMQVHRSGLCIQSAKNFSDPVLNNDCYTALEEKRQRDLSRHGLGPRLAHFRHWWTHLHLNNTVSVISSCVTCTLLS